MPDNSFDLPTPPPDLDPEWLTFLEGLPIGPDEEDQLYNENLERIANFIVARDRDVQEHDYVNDIVRTLAFWLARHKIQQSLLERTPDFLTCRSTLETFDKAYEGYTASIREELWQLIEEIRERGQA